MVANISVFMLEIMIPGNASAAIWDATDATPLAVILDRTEQRCNLNRTMFPLIDHISLVVKKPVFGYSDQVRHKPGCTIIEDG